MKEKKKRSRRKRSRRKRKRKRKRSKVAGVERVLSTPLPRGRHMRRSGGEI
jgi:hypothetical protein